MKRLFDHRYDATFIRDTAVVFAAVFMAVEISVAAYYGVFEPERLKSELITSGLVTLFAGLPAIWILARRNRSFDVLSYRLQRLNDLDQTTGLFNRPAFLRAMQKLLECTPAAASAGAFIHMEVARTQPVHGETNDFELDRAVKSIAATIKESTRNIDLGVRLGDRQFGVFLRDVNSIKAAEVSKRLIKDISRRQHQAGYAASAISISLGIAEQRPGESIRAAMQEAAASLSLMPGEKPDPVVVYINSARAA